MKTVIYTAAHGGFASEAAPLGGGAAIFERLTAEWKRTRPFNLETLTPQLLGHKAPTAAELVEFTEQEYADFCMDFERAATAEILRRDPQETVVLSNDISEGPDFDKLYQAGFRVFTVYHVDVVAYVAAIYGRGLIAPATLVRWHDRLAASFLGRWLPPILRLVFQKQRESVDYSHGLIVPSPGMKEELLRCYATLSPERVHVLPWGVEAAPFAESEVEQAARALRQRWQVPPEALVLLTLSRISPEKGQDLLLDALLQWERKGTLPERPVWLFLCGGAAYMMGRRFERKLRRMAKRLRRVKVVFPGYVTGVEKYAYFRMADVYVFPSRHESYGLTLLEALASGLPAICMDNLGARALMRPELGEVVGPGGLLPALQRILADDDWRKRAAECARAFAGAQPFAKTADALASLLLSS